MTTLMGFILNTVKPRVNDPARPTMWLPALLTGMRHDDGTPVLPIHAVAQDLGQIQGQGGGYIADRFASIYSILNECEAVPDPDRPLPLLRLPDVLLDGLQNMQPAASPDTPQADGYQVKIDCNFGCYTGVVQGITMGPLTISGRYHIDQWLQLSPATPGASPGAPQLISGDGNFSVTLTASKLVAGVLATVTGAGSARQNAITVQSLDLAGTGGGAPQLNVDSLTLDQDLPQKDALMDVIAQALGQPEGVQAMVGSVAAMLNAPDNLASVNALVSDKTAGVIDGIFGRLDPSGLPASDAGQAALTALDQYLFDRMRVALNAPGSSWFLPWQLASSDNPVLDPYTDASVAVPDQTIKGLKYTNIVLTGLVLAGGANAVAPIDQTILDGNAFSSRITLGVLPAGAARQVPRPGGAVSMPVPPGPPVTFGAAFTLVQQGFKPVPLTGRLDATIANVYAPLAMRATGADADALTLTVTAASADLSAARIVPHVALDPRDSTLEQIIDALFAKPEVQQQVLAALNAALVQQQGAISDQFTQIARTAILSQLGG